jgi:formylglycine-generating enzyme required for sulfatase activity
MRRAAWALGLGLSAGGALACSWTLSFDGIDDGVPRTDGGSDTSSSSDHASAEASTVDVSMDADGGPAGDTSTDGSSDVAVDNALTDGMCPLGAPGPAMIPLSDFCIDSTEITIAQYTAFLTAKAGDTSGQPPACLWNTSFMPSGWPQPGAGDTAVVGVDWCDATMYCAWAGKRLCGNADGGSSDPNDWANPAVSEWYGACSRNGDGVHLYPYGLSYDASACNGADYDAGGPLSSRATCQGGYPGLLDLSGNVFEWEDSCFVPAADAGDQTGATDGCNVRGGAFDQGAAGLRCDFNFAFQRSNRGMNTGIRCCSK